MTITLGLDTFGDNTTTLTGLPVHPAETIRSIVEQGQLADSLGVDAFGVGEHHREDYAVSSPEIILAGLATTTNKIKLGTAVTVLTSDDPVRVYEKFATLQALSNNRAEIMAGRGSFIESFPLFGYQLEDYNLLYAEKIDLLYEILNNQPVTWKGETRTSLTNQTIHPPVEKPIPLWVAVGGTVNSVLRAATYNLPVAFAIIGGSPERFKPLTTLYRDHAETNNQIGVHSMGHVGKTDDEAKEQFFPYYEKFHNKLGAERGWGKLTVQQYNQEIETGSLYVGSPKTVANKIKNTVQLLGADRFDLKYATGAMPHSLLMNSIQLFGEEVADQVKNEWP